ncbi:MAG TPA: SUMF1/EgtB/PvdO family nonheme iron enzyme [Magnetococcales bacterium]|nr:SUMF1/EgtB/PvdO family nonheme iron enzyme [Magnetococcales bacterium]
MTSSRKLPCLSIVAETRTIALPRICHEEKFLSHASGNAWEWTSDGYDNKFYANSPKDNPQGPLSGSSRVIRGSSWYDDPASVRSANRDDDPGYRDDDLGFRLSRTCP